MFLFPLFSFYKVINKFVFNLYMWIPYIRLSPLCISYLWRQLTLLNAHAEKFLAQLRIKLSLTVTFIGHSSVCSSILSYFLTLHTLAIKNNRTVINVKIKNFFFLTLRTQLCEIYSVTYFSLRISIFSTHFITLFSANLSEMTKHSFKKEIAILPQRSC